MLKYGPEVSHTVLDASVDVVTAPAELLRQIHIVDTPGTNAIFRDHEALTVDFVPRADFVLFVTSADRPFTEAERGFMESIREWAKKIVVVINKADILDTAADRDSVEPEVFAVWAPAAQTFAALETCIATTLNVRERIRLKLLNPIGVARRLSARYLALVDADLHVLADDVLAIADIDGLAIVFRQDMSREFQHRLSSVDNILHAFERRGVKVVVDHQYSQAFGAGHFERWGPQPSEPRTGRLVRTDRTRAPASRAQSRCPNRSLAAPPIRCRVPRSSRCAPLVSELRGVVHHVHDDLFQARRVRVHPDRTVGQRHRHLMSPLCYVRWLDLFRRGQTAVTGRPIFVASWITTPCSSSSWSCCCSVAEASSSAVGDSPDGVGRAARTP